MPKFSGAMGVVMLVVVGAIFADVLAHPSGTSTAAGSVNNILTSSYKAASGAYA